MWLQRLTLVLALAWMATIYLLSQRSTLPVPSLFPHQDKVLHAGAYGLLAALLLLAFRPGRDGYSFRQTSISVMLASLYGLSDEFHQSFVRGRSSDPLDWIADTLGALIAVSLTAWMTAKYINRTARPADQAGG